MTPAECRTREDIRREIDAIDNQLVDLLAARFGYVRRMAEIKNDPAEARVVSRVDDVLAKVTKRAGERGLATDLAADLWSRLMEWNIAWEEQAMTEHKAAKTNREAGR
jgi:isochorismate pyruvate lyase